MNPNSYYVTEPQLDVQPGRVAFVNEPSQLTGTSCDAGSGGFNYSSSKEFRVPDDWLFNYIPFRPQQEDLRMFSDVIHDRQLAKDQCSVSPDEWMCGMAPNNSGGCQSKPCSTRGTYPADSRYGNMGCPGTEYAVRYPQQPEDGFAPTAAQMPRTNTVYKIV